MPFAFVDGAHCSETLDVAARVATDQAGALASLRQRDDALAQAFVAFESYRTGDVAGAQRARAALRKLETGIDPQAPEMVQYLGFLRLVFNHCDKIDRVPEAMCWPFRVEPEAAYVALQNCETYALGRDEIRRQCTLRLARDRAGVTDERQVSIALASVHALLRELSNGFDKTRADRRELGIDRAVDVVQASLLTATAKRPAPGALERLVAELEPRLPSLRRGLQRFAARRGASERSLARMLRASAPRTSESESRASATVDAALFELLRAQQSATLEICKELYFGYEAEPDAVAARRCLESLEPDQTASARTFLALLYLNGEGGPRELGKAHDLLVRADFDGENDHLLSIVTERLANPSADEKAVPYCRSGGGTTGENNECVSIANRQAERRDRQRLEEISANLPSEARPLLKQLDAQFTAFAENDSSRAGLVYVDGTMSGWVGGNYRLYLREHHDARLREWLVERQAIPPASETALRDARAHLAKALRDARAPRTAFLYAWGPAAHRKAVEASQRSWLVYREAWRALLLRLQPPDVRTHRGLARALEALLTEERAANLDADPALLGPSD